LLDYLNRGSPELERFAIEDSAGRWTYAGLTEHVESAAGSLLGAQRGLDGERIGLFLDPTRESMAAFLGVLAAGAIAVPIATQAVPPEIAYILDDAGIDRVIGTDLHAAKVAAALTYSGRRVDFVRTDTLFEAKGAHSLPTQTTDDPALLLYTSGTTGQSKGVLHAHGSVQNQLEVLRQAWQWTDDDVLLHVLPLHHVHGLINGALGALWAGARVRLLSRFDAAAVWQAFASHEANVFFAVPAVYHQLLEAWEGQDETTRTQWLSGAAALRLAVSGSASLPETLWRRWQDVTGQALLERYGMTEIGMALANPYAGERRPGTVGMALPTMDIRIVGEDGRDVPPGQPGEIWVKGPSLFREYWRRPDATKESFRDGYFLTGDVAQDEDGYVRILGRSSIDIIKSAGYKLSALEIESVLLEHPAIAEVAVVGAADEQWGEVVTACVVLRAGQPLSLADLRLFCGERLSPYKHPRRLQLYDALPRNAMGKVTKTALREQLARSENPRQDFAAEIDG
jgi:malonyl-CoA/methylmalonyl-CoA synthetase